MLEVEALSVSYGLHRVLEDVAVRVSAGEIVVILGANGAGKTTLLNALGGIVAPAPGGRITLDGTPLVGQPSHEIVEAGIALVPEGRGIFGELTVAENLALGAFPMRARDRAETNLQIVHTLFPRLAERGRQLARTLSGGEQQMLAIGRALMSAPDYLLLDEPSLGLSPILCGELFRSLLGVRETGLGVLLVEQNAKRSLEIADRGYVIDQGRVVAEGDAAALKDDPAVQRAYLGYAEE